MQTVHTIAQLRAQLRAARQQGKTIAFVPTMGNLHAGHIALVEEGRGRADFVVASIFVNPTQFGANEDFDKYPRTLEADSLLLAEARCDLLFAPSAQEMYPLAESEDRQRRQQTVVTPGRLAERLCGQSRPGHFDGVATVVSKLFNIVQPDIACFGQKDYQQLAIIRQLTRELCFPIEIVGVPTKREASGLAMSSRNGYLSPEQWQQAALIWQVLNQVATRLRAGDKACEACEQALTDLKAGGFEPDYLELRRQQDLELAGPADTELVILLAARLGATRLIDNLEVVLA